jgi:CRISPR/Cas system-associated exonuclease Cas4 (RecB family)
MMGSNMAMVQNVDAVVAFLRDKAAAMDKDGNASVTVGYTQNYALYVHENLMSKHPVGQAKYLEQPFREMKKEIHGIVAEMLRKRKTMAQALVVAGLRLQRESQLLVPVDTGALKGSAFTRLEE